MRWSRVVGLPSPVVVAALLMVVVVGSADAQLFPNLATRKRARNPREAEPPVFSYYRQNYWGYHPTCWRQFPCDWGCPSPAKADVAKAFRELELDKFPESGSTEDGGRPGTDRDLVQPDPPDGMGGPPRPGDGGNPTAPLPPALPEGDSNLFGPGAGRRDPNQGRPPVEPDPGSTVEILPPLGAPPESTPRTPTNPPKPLIDPRTPRSPDVVFAPDLNAGLPVPITALPTPAGRPPMLVQPEVVPASAPGTVRLLDMGGGRYREVAPEPNPEPPARRKPFGGLFARFRKPAQ